MVVNNNLMTYAVDDTPGARRPYLACRLPTVLAAVRKFQLLAQRGRRRRLQRGGHSVSVDSMNSMSNGAGSVGAGSLGRELGGEPGSRADEHWPDPHTEEKTKLLSQSIA